MRFAAIADVHGNYLALEAVVADIRAQGIDDIVNLGDMASGPLDPRACRWRVARDLPACALRSRRDGGTGAPQPPARTRLRAGDGMDQVVRPTKQLQIQLTSPACGGGRRAR